jgi:hypothetical protein
MFLLHFLRAFVAITRPLMPSWLAPAYKQEFNKYTAQRGLWILYRVRRTLTRMPNVQNIRLLLAGLTLCSATNATTLRIKNSEAQLDYVLCMQCEKSLRIYYVDNPVLTRPA